MDHRAALFGQQYAAKKEQDPELVSANISVTMLSFLGYGGSVAP